MNWQEARGVNRQRASVASAVAKHSVVDNGFGKLPSPELQRLLKGASSHLSYQENFKVDASAAASRFKVARLYAVVAETPSITRVIKGMRTSFAARGVDISKSTC